MMRWIIVSALSGTLIGACAAWYVLGLRYDLALQRIETQQHIEAGKAKDKTLQAVSEMVQQVKTNEAANVSLQKSLLDLRSTVSGMRNDFSTKLTGATESQLRAYSSACTAVFNDMAREGAEMAEAGADLARKADGHASDARLIK